MYCFVNKIVNGILLDTGAQVCLVSKHWPDHYHPDLEIEDVSSLLDEADRLRVRWGNYADILFVGYVDLLIQLENIEKPGIIIPFLVINDTIDCPLLGFNAMNNMLEDSRDQNLLVSLLQNSLDKDAVKTTAMIDFL